MFAIVDIQGHQYKVEKDQEIFVNRMPNASGEKIELSEVLLINDGKNVKLGKPFIKGSKVSVEILDHLKGDKIQVFKKKRRKGYQKLNGHRQALTRLRINSIS